jgi:hypothetical protein
VLADPSLVVAVFVSGDEQAIKTATVAVAIQKKFEVFCMAVMVYNVSVHKLPEIRK